jgi:hypothetical protein
MESWFLVSTTHCLLAVDAEQGCAFLLHSGQGLYFGLAFDPQGRFYVACRNATAGPESEAVRAAERGSVLIFDSTLRFCGELTAPFPLRDVHGIAYFDNRLWVTCSFDNMIAVYHFESCQWRRWHPVPEAAAPGCDIHHFNTVRFINDQIWIVAHRYGSSEILRFDYPDLQLQQALSLGRMAHDIFLFRGVPATCSSADGWIVNTRGHRLRTGNFPRGLARNTNGKLLGLSLNAPRAERAHQSALLRWYTADWRFRADYVLPGVGMVLDILELPLSRDALHGLEPWPDMQVSANRYNSLAPGNWFDVKSPELSREMPGWHSAEESLRWTAAKRASLRILTAPGEQRLRLRLSSSYPGEYRAGVLLDEKWLGEVQFGGPGFQNAEFLFEPASHCERTLTLHVPHLWRPSQLLGTSDPRWLGIALHGIGVDL